ncbi:MAG TPA: lysoplasmalogenase [Nocardioides sp.]|nr:lysoplasmalogenase [Nocardioides sp.]
MPSRRTLAAAAGYTALAAADAVLAGKTSKAARRARFVLKPLLMPSLSVAFTEATRGRKDVLTRSTQAAQAFSWGGDVALLGSGDKAFLTGVGSFAGAHAAYITGFASRRTRGSVRDQAGLKAAAALWATTAPVMGIAAGRKSRELGLPVAGYGTILAAMFAASTLLDPTINASARRTLQAGTALFLLSDSLLGVQEFLLREHSPALESAVMATYTAGQGLIAAGVAQA